MALSANTPMRVELGELNDIPAAASAHPYEGSMVGLASGYARALTAGDLFLGHAYQEADNTVGTAAAANINVRVRQGRYCAQVTITAVAVTDVGKEVFASDDATYTLTRGANSRVGRVVRYVTTGTCIVEFEPHQILEAIAPEVDCGLAAAAADALIWPGYANPRGLVIAEIFARVTEAFAGAGEDQGIVTVSDESDNALATLTATDASGDSVGDIIVGYQRQAASTNDALKTVAAGEYIDCVCTQLTSGAGLTGKMIVYVVAQPLI